MEIPVGNKGIPPLLVADHCDHFCNHRLNQLVFSSVEMPTADRSHSHPVVGGGLLLLSRGKTSVLVGPSLRLFKSMNDGQTALPDNTQVRLCGTPLTTPSGTSLSPDQEISLRCWTLMRTGSKYWRTWFGTACKGKDSFTAPCRRCQPGGRGRRSLLKPRAKQGILTPTPRPSPPWNAGRVVRIETSGGQTGRSRSDIRTWKTSGGRSCSNGHAPFLGKQKMAPRHPAPRTYRNRLVRIHPQPRPQESRDPLISTPGETPPSPRAGPSQRKERAGFSIRAVADRVRPCCPFPSPDPSSRVYYIARMGGPHRRRLTCYSASRTSPSYGKPCRLPRDKS